ncbi:MAG: DUF1080 domain-containing protein [Planctomycetota bacterium]|nr:DUF1080 domain-containing protein [Planctomycetota bacterium]
MLFLPMAVLLFSTSVPACEPQAFVGNWAMRMNDGSSGWLSIEKVEDQWSGQLWRVGQTKAITDRKFGDGKLTIEFNVPKSGNSGIYVRGVYEAQVVDRDSRMQGIHGVGSIFNRIAPSKNAGKPGGEWQSYEIIIVDRHATVVLNGEKVIDNQPILGNTNGAIQADVMTPGPLYLQGDHTAVRYRNIVFHPVVGAE